MDLITIDFETYYDAGYSLSKLTTEEYIRHKAFEVIGVAVKVNDEPTRWYSGEMSDIGLWLRGFDWENSMAVAHNAVFDMAILHWHFHMKPKAIADTLSMARAVHGTATSVSLASLARHYELGEKGTEVVSAMAMRRSDFSEEKLETYGDYCQNDVELTHKLFHKLMPSFNFTEMKLIDLTIRMFTEPELVLDTIQLVDYRTSLQVTKADLLAKVGMERDALMSNPKLALLLTSLGVQPPTKISPATGKPTMAFSKTDKDFIALLEHEDPTVQAVVAARLGVKSTQEETRTQRLIDIGFRGLMPVPLRYYAAHTGRWGGDDKVNLQNLKRGSLIRNAMLAPPGYVIIDCDSSQIEARVLAWLAGQDDLVQAFADGEDVYKLTASKIYKTDPKNVLPSERFVGKTTVLGCGYGMGATKFQGALANSKVLLTLQECETIIGGYRESYPRIPILWKRAQKVLEAIVADRTVDFDARGVLSVYGRQGIKLPSGMFVQYPGLTLTDDGFVYETKRGKQTVMNRIYGGKVVENVCQAVARCIIGEQLIDVSRKYKVVLTVHDAIACIAPEEEAEEAKDYVVQCMRKTPAWAKGLPLNCEAGYGKSYGEC